MVSQHNGLLGNLEHERFRRLRAILAARGLRTKALAAACSITTVHLRLILIGERKPSARLLAELKRQLGENGWLFVLGLTNELAMRAGVE